MPNEKTKPVEESTLQSTEHSIVTIKHLLDYQLSGIEKLRKGEMGAQMLTAQTNAVGKITTLIKVSIELAKATGQNPNQLAGFLGEPKATSKK